MNRWEKAQMYAVGFLFCLVTGFFFVAVSIFVLLCPVIGVDLILKGFPIIGVPLTVILSLVSIAYMVLVISLVVDKIQESR